MNPRTQIEGNTLNIDENAIITDEIITSINQKDCPITCLKIANITSETLFKLAPLLQHSQSNIVEVSVERISPLIAMQLCVILNDSSCKVARLHLTNIHPSVLSVFRSTTFTVENDLAQWTASNNGPSLFNNHLTITFVKGGAFANNATFKQEPINTIHPLDEATIRDAAIRIRGRNNAPENCSYLTDSMMHYFKTGEIKEANTEASTTLIAPNMIGAEKVRIKADPSSRKQLFQATSSVAIRDDDNLYDSLPPVEQMVMGEDGVFDLDQPPVLDFAEPNVARVPVRFSDVNDALLYVANTRNSIIWGEITLAPCEKTKKAVEEGAGHSIYFYVIPASDDHLASGKVILIDPQLHNGLTAEGDPIFYEMHEKFNFINGPKSLLKDKTLWGENCFYIIHHRFPLNQLKRKVEMIEDDEIELEHTTQKPRR